MFRRAEFKKAAKARLKGRWKIPVLSTLLLLLIVNVFVIAMGMIFPDKIRMNMSAGAGSFNYGIHADTAPAIYSVFVCLVATVFYFAQLILLEKMFKSAEPVFFEDFTDALGQWFRAVRAMVWKMLWIWLWSLLFVIPGIIKRYSYSMMFFVMAEHPNLGVVKAMNISKELTRGYKGELFMTDLSFILYFILGVLSMGIGFLWIVPYYQATYTCIYHELKEIALKSARVKAEDFE